MDDSEYDEAVAYMKSRHGSPEWPPWILQLPLTKDVQKNAKRVYRKKWEKYIIGQADFEDVIIKTERRKEQGGDTRAAELRLIKASQKERVLTSLHVDATGGHFGTNKTKEKLGERYFWKGYTEDVVKFCANCAVCLKANKMPKKIAELHPVGIPKQPLRQWGMDLVGPLPETPDGYKYLMVMTEYTTKWPEVYPINEKSAEAIFRQLKHLIGRFGCPETIISDQGREFCNALNDLFCEKFSIKRRVTTAYRPQENGLTERINQTICRALAKFTDGGKTDWTVDLDLILLGYRSSRQESSKYTPFELMYGVKARLPIDLDLATEDGDDSAPVSAEERIEALVNLAQVREKAVGNAKAAQNQQKEQYARRHGGVKKTFKVGDNVFYANVRNKSRQGGKIKHKNQGPTVVEEVCEGNVYHLRGVKRKYHADDLMVAPTLTEESEEKQVKQQKGKRAKLDLNWWVQEWNLKQEQKEIIEKGAWLDDTVMDAAQKLIQMRMDPTVPHQSTLMAQKEFETVFEAVTLQLLYNGSNHCVLVAAMDERVLLYDSMNQPPNAQLVRQLKELFASRLDVHGKLRLERVAVHQQRNGYDCGVFAIAFAFFLICTEFADDIRSIRFEEDAMRAHLVGCLERQAVEPFPLYLGSTPGKNGTTRNKTPKANVNIAI